MFVFNSLRAYLLEQLISGSVIDELVEALLDLSFPPAQTFCHPSVSRLAALVLGTLLRLQLAHDSVPVSGEMWYPYLCAKAEDFVKAKTKKFTDNPDAAWTKDDARNLDNLSLLILSYLTHQQATLQDRQS